MKLDRNLQLYLLTKMSEKYPNYWELNQEHPNDGSDEYKNIEANLYYLMQHDLIEKKSIVVSNSLGSGFNLIINLPTISHKGMDFLADDGGLSAILNIITVKFEADTLKTILENRIIKSDLNPEEKESMIESLRELPAESIKHLTMKLLDEGLENLPSAILLIGTFLGLS